MKPEKLRWSPVPRVTPANPSDRRAARLVRVARPDGSEVEYRVDPARNLYAPHWIVSQDGMPVATARTAIMAMQTVARAVGAPIGG